MSKTAIDLSTVPAGLTKKEFIKRPEMKKIKSWFNWGGVVQLVTGLLSLSTVGQLAEYQAQGYSVPENYMMLFSIASIVFIALGVALLVTKSSEIAYIVGITGILWAIFTIATGGSLGAGIVGIVLALVGARKADNAWKEYTSGYTY